MSTNLYSQFFFSIAISSGQTWGIVNFIFKIKINIQKDREEINRVKPFDIGLDKRKTAPMGTAFPVMSG